MNKKQFIVALGLIAYVLGGLVIVIMNVRTFLEIIRFRLDLLMPIFSTYSIILIIGLLLIYLLKDRSRPGSKVRCSKCNKVLLTTNARVFFRKYWCKEHYNEAIKSLSSEGDIKSKLSIKVEQYLASINKKQFAVVLIGIFIMLPLVHQISGKTRQISKWANKDYLAMIHKTYPEIKVEQIDSFSLKKRALLRRDIFWLFVGLVTIAGATASFYNLYKKGEA